MYLKDVLSAMTTSPVEGQIGNTRKTGANACVHMPDLINMMIRRIDHGLDQRLADAHIELSSNKNSSISPTCLYLNRFGDALVCRSYKERLHLKSAKLDHKKWIVWNNSAVDESMKSVIDDVTDRRQALFSRITRMMRVNTLELYCDDHGSWFVKCNCGRRENLGVPCPCYFRICENAKVPIEKTVDIAMISPRYLKCWQTHYRTESKLGQSLYNGQKEAFIDKRKGIRVPCDLAEIISGSEDANSEDFPTLGPNTYPRDYREAKHMLSLDACALDDVIKYRVAKKRTVMICMPLPWERKTINSLLPEVNSCRNWTLIRTVI